MLLHDSTFRFSATDLSRHVDCRHRTVLEAERARGLRPAPSFSNSALELLAERGLAHEKSFVAHLRSLGKSVVEMGDALPRREGLEQVLVAMRAGADVIVQAPLSVDRWSGVADLLLKTRAPRHTGSSLGDWVYEVADTKLSLETRASTLLQLSLYASLLEPLQGVPAPRMHVVMPGDGTEGEEFSIETFAYADTQAYFRRVQRELQDQVEQANYASATPDPVAHCDVCPWWSVCEKRWRDEDHLSLVAGMPLLHAGELRRQGIDTVRQLARAKPLLAEPPRQGRRETFERLQAQAEIQVRGRDERRPVHELLEVEEGRGLARLPDPDCGDLFFDFEGDPFVDDGGLEYLFGYAWYDAAGSLQYTALWALDRATERRALQQFLDFVTERRRSHPGLHVYHYAPYEPAALKRLASRHATHEAELDVLLRAEVFVDLHAVVRQGLRASVESYSLKALEPFFGYERRIDLRAEAGPALQRLAAQLEQGESGSISEEDRRLVEGYNEDDCRSLVPLRDWLESLRTELVALGHRIERPAVRSGEASEVAEEKRAEVVALKEALTRGLSLDERSAWSEEQKARWLLSNLLEYFDRERRVGWWEYFARRDMEVEELLADRKALVELEFLEDRGTVGRQRIPTHRYRFPRQECGFGIGDSLYDLEAESAKSFGTVAALDESARTLDLKPKGDSLALRPWGVHTSDEVSAKELQESLLQVGRSVVDEGLEANTTCRAGADLLLRRPPRSPSGRAAASLRNEGESELDAALRIARNLDGGVLAVQGPPGSGKTYTGARMIARLAAEGKKVGICAVSHKVIRNLLKAVHLAARELRLEVRLGHKPSSRSEPEVSPEIVNLATKDKAIDALASGTVVGGVAWLWSDEDLTGALDYLFIDEAGQLSLAMALASCRSTRNLILLGDPQQLQQPQRGAHPEGAEVSALHHLLDGRPTIPPELGLFLPVTRRLAPALCQFTSEIYYEGRLESHPPCAQHRIAGSARFSGSGLRLVTVHHEGNQSSCPQEADAVERVVEDLLRKGVTWSDSKGVVRPLTRDDLLVIAPYNLQVTLLSRRLPGIEVGTVDRFQGQERPVVIYSMTSSSIADAPRGMEFLLDPHRFNVATSRAQCLVVLICAPALLSATCRTPRHVVMANGLCRYAELAQEGSLE